MHFQHLTDIHTRRNAQGVEQNLQRRAVCEERHIRLRKHAGDDAFVAVTARHFIADGNFSLLRDIDADQLVDARFQLVLVLPREHLDVHDHAAFAVRNAQRSVAHFSRLLAENGAEQPLLGREFRLALGRNFTDENIAALHFRADAHDAVLVEVFQRVVAHVGDIARDFFLAEFGVSRLRLVFFNVNRGEHVVLHQLFGKQDGVLVVVAFPLHIADEYVLAEREFAVVGRRTVGDDLTLGHPVSRRNDRPLIEAGALVGPLELFEGIFADLPVVLANADHIGSAAHHDARFFCHDHDAGILGDRRFNARGDDGRFRLQKRHSLALHVGTHQRAVGIVVFEERNERRSHGNQLFGRNVHVIDLLAGKLGDEIAVPAADPLVDKAPGFVERFVRLRDDITILFVRRQIIHVIGDDSRFLVHPAIRAHDEAVFVHLGKRGKRGDQTDVLAFGRLDGAHSSVMSVMNVTDFKGRAVAVETAGAEGRQFTLVREFGDRVGLVHELGELGGSEEFPDDRRHRTDIDEPGRGHFHRVLRSHSLLDQAFQTGDAHAELILEQFAHRAHAAVAEVVDVVDRADAVFEVEVGGHGSHDIVHGDVLVAQLIRKRTDLLFLFLGRNGIVAAKHGVESFARLHELAAVVTALFAVLLLFLLLVRLFRPLVRIVKRVDLVDVFFSHFLHRHALAVGGNQFGEFIVGIINGGQQTEILGTRF